MMCMEGEMQLSVTPFLSNHAVLQRDEEIVVRGRGRSGCEIFAELKGPAKKRLERRGVAGDGGTWRLVFPPLPAGGPYELRVKSGGEALEFTDIFIGDVWLLAGQSNMQLPMERVKYRYPEEYREGASPLIRQFAVPICWNFDSAQAELSGGEWKTAAAEYTPVFSAVGFFFAKKLYERYNVPVGLVLTAVGGTPVQAWMSREALREFPDELEKAEALRAPGLVKRIQRADEERIAAWWRLLDEKDPGILENWAAGGDEGSGNALWKKTNLTDSWEGNDELSGTGTVWLRKHVNIPHSRAGKPVRISLGTVTDADVFYVNGIMSGSVSYRYPPREYELPGLNAGDNLLVLRVAAVHGQGGFTRGKKHRIIWEDGRESDISSGWEYRRGAVMEPLEEQTFFERMPLGMYQAMTAPLHDFPVRGICWYQGEMNADEPGTYPGYFSRLTADWREKWKNPRLPVLFVQLPCYDLYDAGHWVEFREMQRGLTAIPDTAMVVTTDCGEVNDLHPVSKKPVGERLAMAAFQLAYGECGTWLSPVFSFGETEESGIVLHFEHADDGLETVDGEMLCGFEYGFCGESPECSGVICRRIPAEAALEGNRVRAALPESGGRRPDVLLYAWSNQPEGNLCNSQKLPASPFRYLIKEKG